MDDITANGSTTQQTRSSDFSWPFWPVVPLYPYGQRRTIRNEVVDGWVWTFDQVQGIFYVVVPIRMTVVKLAEGGLLVYAPIAPTPECLRLVEELVEQHGEVRYIILPTVSGIEHKVFVGPFARHFAKAQVYVAPDQWSFPINLPLNWLGFPARRTHFLPEDSGDAPFADEFDYARLGPIDLGLGSFEEVVVLHKRSRTLLVTDCVMSIPEEPPAIVQLDPYPLLFHAKDDAFSVVEDTPWNRKKGWKRIALFSFYFRPNALQTVGLVKTVRDSFSAPDRSRQAYFGLYPFRWKEGWQRSYDALRCEGRLLVAPILQALILNRAPKETLDWADTVASWNFQRIIPCHLDAPITAEPTQFRQAFTFLEKTPSKHEVGDREMCSLPEEDFEFLRDLDETLNKTRITPPPKERV